MPCGGTPCRPRGRRSCTAACGGCGSVLGTAAIDKVPSGYRLTLGDDELDHRMFERLLERGREALAGDDPARATFLVEEGLGLWRGQGAGRPRGVGAGAGGGRAARGSADGRRGAARRGGGARPATRRRCWSRRGPSSRRRRSGSGAGRCWPPRCTSPAGNARPSAPCSGPARCWSTSSAWIPAASSSSSSSGCCGRTRP